MNRKYYSFISGGGIVLKNKKEQIDKAAYEIFQKNGYKKTNISEVAQHAGIAVGSFYKYYQSKEELFLQIYIIENEKIRNQLIETVNWNDEPTNIVDKIFDYSIEVILSNKILAEWNNPDISNTLHNYYSSKKGKLDNTFHQFLLKTIKERLKDDYDTQTIDNMLNVYELIYFIDCNITNNDFVNYAESLKIMVRYFIKGLLQ
ncbi:transcriptional regulator, TetR family [Bacillus cytotoxicus NVH 391-98]|uniref:Transcriptional regulator, TetR family n=1 Tax=Bacillus cytotoxicus (strain DSM 22905 / CIP 110041 / 391-98 / NVH 391-98) TaxID=315749 RepID=A7GKW2_BACCN|nr:transcriptional regulator, TetR family [Bacillus cytotoxicus NVH 391-98]AWC43509.1 TetR/AcrR family transcriptional regulator [Bacillus cytotoxicus]NZD33648.1 TetR/AcrR family transcriptional regulator [Bacillus cytotoxicus]